MQFVSDWVPSKYWAVGLVTALLFVYFMPRAVLYATWPGHGWFVVGLILCVVPSLVYLSAKAFAIRPQWVAILTPLTPLIVGPTFGMLWKYREKHALQEQGVWTQGIVSSRGKIQPRRGKPHWEFCCTFTVGGKIYQTAYKPEGNYARAKGDTLDIIYCRDYPKINEIGYLFQNQ